MSPGTSNAYMVLTAGGRVIVNTGLGFEALTHERNFDAVSRLPTTHILVTQGHVDHVGGVGLLRRGRARASSRRPTTCAARPTTRASRPGGDRTATCGSRRSSTTRSRWRRTTPTWWCRTRRCPTRSSASSWWWRPATCASSC
ncbi:MAG: MBL fold metallo-hydrolase [Sandaracinaceae bacterium]|nr:MBL fold metallo-hydrolase [Sandaracinaceae bacterium]